MTTILNELDFNLPEITDNVITSTNDVVLNSASNTHTPTNNSIIRFNISGSGYLQPHSCELYADVTFTFATAANFISPCMYELFDSIRILDQSGQVLEEVTSSAGLLNRVLHNASSSSDYLDCSPYTNSQKDVNKRYAVSAVAKTFRINALEVMGLFQQEKYLHLPSFKGGLQLECRLASTDALCTNKVPDATLAVSLSNVQLMYTEVQVSEAYQQLYNEKLMSGGYGIAFPSYSHLSNGCSEGYNMLALNKSVSKCKSIVSVVRNGGDRNNEIKSETSTRHNVVSYQYQVNGKNVPSQAITSKARAFQELLTANYNHKNNQYANVCDDFERNFEFATVKTATDVKDGTYAMWIDLEKSSSAMSGVRMEGNSSFLKISLEAGQFDSPVVDTFVCYEKILSVQPQRVVVVE